MEITENVLTIEGQVLAGMKLTTPTYNPDEMNNSHCILEFRLALDKDEKVGEFMDVLRMANRNGTITLSTTYGVKLND